MERTYIPYRWVLELGVGFCVLFCTMHLLEYGSIWRYPGTIDLEGKKLGTFARHDYVFKMV